MTGAHMKKIPVTISVSKEENERMSIELMDQMSRVRFLHLDLSMEEFGKLIAGITTPNCKVEVKDLHLIGKSFITEEREIEVPYMGSIPTVYESLLAKNKVEDGWMIDSRLRSPGAITKKGNKAKIRFNVFKYSGDPV
jgi:hypothetical protein